MPARLLLALFLGLPLAACAQDAQTILHLLDYIGVDYPGAVDNGKVRNTDEYAEMQEFTAQVTTRLRELPRSEALVRDAQALAQLVAYKAPPPAVAASSSNLRRAIVEAYKLRLAPRGAPPLERAPELYAKNCAACHGADGRGDGPAAKGLEPAPSDFHDLERMAQRSAYGLYNTITLGVAGTSMVPFKHLSEDERWALAFHVANVGVPVERVREGRKLWEGGTARRAFPDLGNVATLSTREVASRFGDTAALVQDFLRAHPEAIRPAPVGYARRLLGESVDALRRGDRTAARDAAMKSYLEGYEFAEAPLANLDPDLMRGIEREMLDLRGAIERGEAADAYAARAARIDGLLAKAADRLGAGELSGATAFTASLVILLREGLEAILVLAAIVAFVLKTGRRDALPWVHGGWIAALWLGAATWVAATYVIDISGANRELTEGVTALIAAGMLLYVGYWLHGKSYAQAWSQFLKEHVGRALERRTLWAMAGVSFLAVYREMFEVVLFYQALWVQAGPGGHAAVLGGIGAAAVALAAIGFAILKYSVRLPIGPFFGWTSGLLALLAVVFTGHGIAALHEAGVVGVHGFDFSAVPLLGIYPSAEALGAQLLALLLVAYAFLAARPARATRAPTTS
ncbi:MAG: cytochrome c/FTR1 family iron permease [Burkholderiales bacterium]